MSTYGIKWAYQHNGEMHPFAVDLCVSSFLLTLRTGLVATRPPEGGERGCCLYPRSISNRRIQDTETQRWAGLERQRRRSLLLIKSMTSYSILADHNDNIEIAILISNLSPFISGSADL